MPASPGRLVGMNTMRVLTQIAPRQIEWRDRSVPTLGGPEQAIVRPLAVARCDLDRPIATGRVPLTGPFELGHEAIAEVIAVGDDVRDVAAGDVVVVPFQISCGRCRNCLAGRTASCEAVPALAAYGLGPFSGHEWGGALADVLLVPFADAMLVKLPTGVSPWIAAAAADNIVDGWRSVAGPLQQRPNEGVLVVGGGAPSIGLYAVAAARALGAGAIVYVDESPDRLAIAESLGAEVVAARPRHGLLDRRFAVTVDASAHPEGLRLALDATAVEGTCTSVSMYTAELPLPLFGMYTRGIRFVTGRANVRADLPHVLAQITSTLSSVERVITARASWDDAAEAWLAPATKLVITRA
jgi:alcohol dehydrogenase